MDALKSILDQSVGAVLSNLPVGEDNEFDTHDFITAFLNFNEPVYADLFVRYKDADGAFRAFHSAIAHYMNALEKRGLIAKVCVGGKKKRVRSRNIKGNLTYNQVWVKL